MYARLASGPAFVLQLLLTVSSDGGAPLHRFNRESSPLLLSRFCPCEGRATPVTLLL